MHLFFRELRVVRDGVRNLLQLRFWSERDLLIRLESEVDSSLALGGGERINMHRSIILGLLKSLRRGEAPRTTKLLHHR